MRKAGFHSFKTIEVRLREHFVDEVELELPPKAKLPKVVNPSGPDAPSVRFLSVDNSKLPGGGTNIAEGSNDDAVAELDNNAIEAETGREPTEAIEQCNGAIKDGVTTATDDGTTGECINGKRKTMVCARPFATMRGHTAFLTFCTAGNKAHPNPNEEVPDSHAS